MRFLITLLALITLQIQNVNSQIESDSLREILENLHGGERIAMLAELTHRNICSDPNSAITSGEEALGLLERDEDPAMELTIMIDMSKAYRYTGQHEKALKFGLRAVKRAIELEDNAALSNAYTGIGITYHSKGDKKLGLEYLLSALGAAQKSGDKTLIAKRQNNVGIVYSELNQEGNAIEHFIESLKINEALGNRKAIGSNTNNLGILYQHIKDFDRSLQYFQRALAIDRELGESDCEATTLNNMGLVYWDMGESENALAHFSTALTLHEKNDNIHGIAMALNNLGLAYEQMGEFEKALDHYNRSLAIKCVECGEESIARTHANIGVVNHQLGNNHAALQSLSIALKMAIGIQAKGVLMTCYETQATIYASQGDYKKAYEAYLNFKQVSDSMYDEDFKHKIAEVQTKYEIEKKEKEIKLLQKDMLVQELELKRQTTIRNALILAFSLLLILAAIIFRMYRRLKIALKEIKILSGLLPICSSCKKVRDDKGYWSQIETYISARSDASFSHGLCPECMDKLYPDYLKEKKK